MKGKMKVWIIFFTLLMAFPVYGTTLMDTGWERSTQNGCNFSNSELYDGGQWEDGCCQEDCPGLSCPAGGSSTAWSGAPMRVVSGANVHSGNHALEMVYMDNAFGGCNDDANGPYACITHAMSPREVYIRYYVKWSSGFYFTGPMKQILLYGSGGTLYLQLWGEGNGSTGTYGFEAQVPDTVYLVKSGYAGNAIQRNKWYLVEWHVRCGSGGTIELKIDGVKQAFEYSAGRNVGDINTNTFLACNSINNFKLDHTYNNWSSFVSNVTSHQYIWYDDLKVNDGDGWIGGTGTPVPPVIGSPTGGQEGAPAPPQNLHIQ